MKSNFEKSISKLNKYFFNLLEKNEATFKSSHIDETIYSDSHMFANMHHLELFNSIKAKDIGSLYDTVMGGILDETHVLKVNCIIPKNGTDNKRFDLVELETITSDEKIYIQKKFFDLFPGAKWTCAGKYKPLYADIDGYFMGGCLPVNR